MSKGSSGFFDGTKGNPQGKLDLEDNSGSAHGSPKPTYAPSPKHEPNHNWGSVNPVKTQAEGQRLLDNGYSNGKQVFNITDDGIIVKFQPDGTPNNGYHSYAIASPNEIPTNILRQMLDDGKITRHRYIQIISGNL